MTPKLHIVHVRINDAATGQPTPCRVRFTDSAGKYYAPFGRQTDFMIHTLTFADVGANVELGSERFAYIDGTCEIALPPGLLRVQIHKGPEYRALDVQVTLVPAKLALRFSIKRWTNLRELHWFSGDTCARFLDPHTALLEAGAEDLAVVNLLAHDLSVRDENNQSYVTNPNLTAFSGQKPALESPGHMVVVNTINGGARLGALGLLHCHRIVFPLSFDDQHVTWTMADWCDQCHRKGGLVVWNIESSVRIPDSLRYADIPCFAFGEAGADMILGKIDAAEINQMFVCCSAPNHDWYQILNAGFRLPLVGSAAKYHNWAALGQVRTYAHVDDEGPFTYGKWIEGIRAGKTFVTNGPFLTFEVEGRLPGSVLRLSSTGKTPVSARAWFHRPLERLEVVVNGHVVATAEPTNGSNELHIDAELVIPASAWIAARCEAPLDESAKGRFGFIGAHTSPTYLEVDGLPFRGDPAIWRFFIEYIDWWTDWLLKNGRFESDAIRDRMLGVFGSAREVVMRRLNPDGSTAV